MLRRYRIDTTSPDESDDERPKIFKNRMLNPHSTSAVIRTLNDQLSTLDISGVSFECKSLEDCPEWIINIKGPNRGCVDIKNEQAINWYFILQIKNYNIAFPLKCVVNKIIRLHDKSLHEDDKTDTISIVEGGSNIKLKLYNKCGSFLYRFQVPWSEPIFEINKTVSYCIGTYTFGVKTVMENIIPTFLENSVSLSQEMNSIEMNPYKPTSISILTLLKRSQPKFFS